MPRDIFDAAVTQAIGAAQAAARRAGTRQVAVDGLPQTVRSPFPSPADWRDT